MVRRVIVLILFLLFGFSVAEGAVFDVSTPTEFQNALTEAQSNGENDVINVQADMTITATLTYQTDNGDGGHSLTINGNGHSLDGGGSVRIMNIDTDTGDNGGDAGGNITIRDLTFQNGNAGYGGGLWVSTTNADVVIDGCTFSGNSAGSGYGGGALVGTTSGSATLTNNTFSGNSGWDGGGAYVVTLSGNITLTNNTFFGNSAGYGGGAVVWLYFGRAKAYVYNNIFWQNTGQPGDDLYVQSDGDGNGTGSTCRALQQRLLRQCRLQHRTVRRPLHHGH
jgi:hypothetical protein